MKKLTLLVTTLFLTLSCFAQDIIVTKDGRKINAVVSEIELEVVKYKNFDNQSGPTISIRRSDIASIVYQNGGVEVFNDKPIVSTLPTPTQKISTDYLRTPEYRAARGLCNSGSAIACIGGALMFSGLWVGLFADAFTGFIILMPLGSGMVIPGAICAGVGRARMNAIRNQSINLYSYNLLKTEKNQLSLTVNPNKVGLSLKF